MEDLVTRVGGRMGGYTILVEDTAACDGTFLIHYMIMKLLTAESNSRVVLLGLSEPFSHYNRVARKQGCNLQSWSDKGRFAFIGLSPGVFNSCGRSVNASGGEKDSGSMADASKESQFHPSENPFISLYLRIRDFVKNVPAQEHITGSRVGRQTCILIDDISVLEVIAGGVESVVLDFVHYCQALSCGDKRCSVVMLTHQDVHESWPAKSYLGLELEFVSDTVVNVEPLATGLAADVHGQIVLFHRNERYEYNSSQRASGSRLQRFQFRILESGVQYFLPGHTLVQ